MKTIRIGDPGSKRIQNRGEAAQCKATASHQAIITREQFEAVQREKERGVMLRAVVGRGSERAQDTSRHLA